MATFDLIVVGAGHAGCEAAAVAARLGRRVACITLDLKFVARLSCNPAIGGLAKGHLVREIDALGGLMGRVADASSIQFRRLNTRKGLAVQSSRAQVDIDVYPKEMQQRLFAIKGLEFIEGEVAGICTHGGRVTGVTLLDGRTLDAPAVCLTTGTFLSGVMHCGEEQKVGGRIGDGAAHALSDGIKGLGITLGRLKTGTVPRLDGRTIQWDRLEEQKDTLPNGQFSFGQRGKKLPQIPCHVVHTNEDVHQIIRDNLDRSPLFSGTIQGTGPRYCPSIEDKVVRFPQRDRHLLFLEPEGLNTHRVYVNGLSTSLPSDVQEEVVHQIPGLEKAEIIQYGYAVEYDFSDPSALGPDLQSETVRGLYFAGQVNGTSGYEEAAAQGFVAGASAALGEPFQLGRDEAYMGVLIDDLVCKGVGGEPYRMFTSRAEHRLLLREDNADRRLMPRGRALGLIDDETWALFEAKCKGIEQGRQALEQTVRPETKVVDYLKKLGLGGLKKPASGMELLRRPTATYKIVSSVMALPEVSPGAAEQIEIDVKYEGYIALAARRAESSRKMDHFLLPDIVDWTGMESLSWEIRERLTKARPKTLGQLGRIPGVTPAAVNVVADWLAQQQKPAI